MSIFRIFSYLCLSFLLSACGGGGDGDETHSETTITYALSVVVTDQDSNQGVSNAIVDVSGNTQRTDTSGRALFSLPSGNYIVAISHADFGNIVRNVTVGSADSGIDITLSKTKTTDGSESGSGGSEDANGYVFHSQNADSFDFAESAVSWGSNSSINENPSDTTYARAIEVTSGTGYGVPYAELAWGNRNPADAIDASAYNQLRFKVKSAFATQVEVSIQGVNSSEDKETYAINTGMALSSGWIEMQVPFPAFTDLTWIGLQFSGRGTVLVADVYLVEDENAGNGNTYTGDYVITPYGAGSISDTFNPEGYGCAEDHGFWVFNAGVVKPGVESCANIGTPTKIYPQLVPELSDQPVPTHKWWGSVSFLGEMRIGDPDSAAYITPDPISARISERGFRMLGIPSGLRGAVDKFEYTVPAPFDEVFDGISIANSQFSDMEGYLKDHSDGAMTVEWRSGTTPIMEATFVHGSPYVYVKAYQGDIVLKTLKSNGGEKGTFSDSNNMLGVWTNVAGNRTNFLIVGEGETTFTEKTSNRITVINNAKEATIALLPGTAVPSNAVSNGFAALARQVVRDVEIDYEVNRANNQVTVTHTYLDNNGNVIETLAGLHPLHWKNSSIATTNYKMRSARGVIKFSQTNAFSYTMPFVGVLPYLPSTVGDFDTNTLKSLVTEYVNKGSNGWNPYTDTYWSGKSYGKAAEVIAIARSIGMTTEANTLTNWLKSELEDWFSADTNGGLDAVKYFVYDETWTTLLGVEESFGAHQQLNDHHFHYGYFVRAAAEICRTDKSWCAADQYGPMVELLIRDYAASKGDDMFPYLRNFDPANGFSWASGHANFALGNNNESTSEAANSYGAIVLYGLITGDDELVEKGMYLHASSSAAYWEYWNNLDGYRNKGADYDNFPAGYDKITTSIIWGTGGVFSTWFSGAYAHILGIQGLPLNPLVFHVGLHADYMKDYVALGVAESNNGKPSGLVDGQWRDIWWNLWAMTDADAAIADYETVSSNYITEEGESKAHTYHWIHTWKALGHLMTGTGSLTADSPTAVAFKKGNQMTYVAYNFQNTSQQVQFSDGTTLTVPANSFGINTSGSSGN